MPIDTTKLLLTNFAIRGVLGAAVPRLAVGAPAPSEDPNHPFVNVFVNDRSVKWKQETTGSDESVVIDLGSVKSAQILGVLSFSHEEGASLPNSCLPYSYITYPNPVVSNCVLNSTVNVTRPSGSFITDGVKVGQTVTGSTVPPNTVVNTVLATSLVLSNATGTGNPVVLTFTDIRSYPAIGIPAIGNDSIDGYVDIGAPTSMRYVRFDFSFSFGPFTVGKFLVAQVTDLGIAYSPGTTEAIVRTGVSNRATDGRRTFTKTGQDIERVSMQFQKVRQSTKDALVSAVKAKALTMIHPTLGLVELGLPDDEFECSHVWGSPDLWDIVLKGETLP